MKTIKALVDINIADKEPWKPHWRITSGTTKKVPDDVAARVIERGQAELVVDKNIEQTATENDKKLDPYGIEEKTRNAIAKKLARENISSTQKIPDALKAKLR